MYAFLHLTEEAPKGSIPKVAGVLSCGFLLCLGLSNVASAADELKTRPSDKMISGLVGDSEPGKTVKGEVLRVQGDNYYFVKEEDGKVVRMHVDSTTSKKALRINP